jgi:hypothetical protein
MPVSKGEDECAPSMSDVAGCLAERPILRRISVVIDIV